MRDDADFDHLPRHGIFGFILDKLTANPTATGGTAVMLAFSIFIIVNAIFLQTTKHPNPLFGPVRQANLLPDVVAANANAGKAPARQPTLIERVQTELSRRGYYRNAIDGRLSPQLDAAIRQYQSLRGMVIDGQPSEALLFDLGGNAANRGTPPQAAVTTPPPPVEEPPISLIPVDATTGPLPIPRPGLRQDLIQDLITNTTGTDQVNTPANPPTKAAQTQRSGLAPADVPPQAASLPSLPQEQQPPAPPRPQTLGGGVQTLKAIQEILVDLGFGPTNMNGVMTQQTHEAIIRFEREHGMPSTGEVTDRLIMQLRALGRLQ